MLIIVFHREGLPYLQAARYARDYHAAYSIGSFRYGSCMIAKIVYYIT